MRVITPVDLKHYVYGRLIIIVAIVVAVARESLKFPLLISESCSSVPDLHYKTRKRQSVLS